MRVEPVPLAVFAVPGRYLTARFACFARGGLPPPPLASRVPSAARLHSRSGGAFSLVGAGRATRGDPPGSSRGRTGSPWSPARARRREDLVTAAPARGRRGNGPSITLPPMEGRTAIQRRGLSTRGPRCQFALNWLVCVSCFLLVFGGYPGARLGNTARPPPGADRGGGHATEPAAPCARRAAAGPRPWWPPPNVGTATAAVASGVNALPTAWRPSWCGPRRPRRRRPVRTTTDGDSGGRHRGRRRAHAASTAPYQTVATTRTTATTHGGGGGPPRGVAAGGRRRAAPPVPPPRPSPRRPGGAAQGSSARRPRGYSRHAPPPPPQNDGSVAGGGLVAPAGGGGGADRGRAPGGGNERRRPARRRPPPPPAHRRRLCS